MSIHNLTLSLLLFAPVLAAQQLTEGFADQLLPLPASASSPRMLANDALVFFDGNDLWHTVPGQPAQSLLHVGSFVFGSFTIETGTGQLLFAENTTNNLWLVPLQGPQPAQPLANLAFNYDAAMWDAQRAIVSAKTGGFGTPDNDLVLLDLGTGMTQSLASIPGASGPVVVAANGDLYYATASLSFPTPPGQTSILRFRHAVVAAAIQQSTVLGIGDAELVFAGIDAAADICLDDDDDLWFTDWFTNTLGELNDVDGPAPWLSTPRIDYGVAPGAAAVQFLAGNSAAVFEAFQPAGGSVVVFETDFFSSSALRRVSPRRAELVAPTTSPIPSGILTLQIVDGPSNGFGLLAIALDDTPGSSAFDVFGFEQPLHWSLALLGAPILWPASFDAQGTMSVALSNPGFVVPAAATAQAALLSSIGELGSSSSRSMMFGQ